MALPVLLNVTRVKVHRLHQRFFFGKVVLSVMSQLGKNRFQFRQGSARLAHDQIAKAINDIDQTMVLHIDIGQPGDKTGVPAKRFHEILPNKEGQRF
jgi:hypothetical protein